MADQTNNNNPTPESGQNGNSGSDYKTIDAYLLGISIAIQNSGHDEIAPALLAFGYSRAEIEIGTALLTNAVDKHQIQVREYGDQYRATDDLHLKIDLAKGIYLTHLGVARVAFKKERGILAEINASGSRKHTISGWLNQAKTFYKNILGKAEYKAGMAKFGQTEPILKMAADKLNEVETAIAKQQKETGEAQTSTRTRDQALDALALWSDDYVDIARIALKDTPHLLEILGLKQVA
ncbi:MAG: hypothetical protein Q8M15_06165 [Bacteroidota bacterium]|nr:hypothetical protein [Bacteroidota bacterium]